MLVRKATPNDIPEILEMYKLGLEENDMSDYKEELLLKKVVNSFHLAPCFILVIDGKIVGMAGMTAVTSSHSGVASLADYMFYIYPDSRDIKSLGALVESIKDFAKSHSLPIRLEFIVNNDEALRRRVLEMHGFKPSALVGIYNG